MSSSTLEYWLQGEVPGVPALLQPVAHALLQAQKEIKEAVADFPGELIWEQPKGTASVTFHLQHIPGVLDRLFTYAKGLQLAEQQLTYLAQEGKRDDTIDIDSLIKKLDEIIEISITQLKNTDINRLTDTRGVGRKQIPSTVIGLLFHAAEHTMRHTGQLLVTCKILNGK